jgi:RNA polymerase sigma-70 factor (ECF subfamily)
VEYSTFSDEVLLSLIAQADTDALAELYDRFSRLVYSIAWHVLNDQGAAEEVTLDVFIHVWSRASTFHRERAKVSTWLSSMARYRAIDVLRKEGVRPLRNSVSWADAALMVASESEGPEEMAERDLRRERLRAAIARLPAEQREVLSLAYFRGYSHSQIAVHLGQPLGTVKTRIRLAMQKLRADLQDEQVMQS